MPELSIPEIIEMVVDQLQDDKAALTNCSVVSKVWLLRSRYYLFRTVQIIVRASDRNLDAASTFFRANPNISACVQHLHVRAAQSMKVPELSMDDFAGVWPIPLEAVDIGNLCHMLQSFPNPVSMDMEGVYMQSNAGEIVSLLPSLRTSSLRKLTIRDVLIPPSSFGALFNLTNVFTGLDDLTMDKVLFDTAGVTMDMQATLKWAGDFNVTNLVLRNVSGMLNLLPTTAFRHVRRLDIPMLTLLIPDAARYLIPLYPTLEEMYLGEL